MIKLNPLKMSFQEIYYIFWVLIIIICSPILIVLAIYLKLQKIAEIRQTGKNIKGQVALITGSAKGLGRLLAIELAKRGCHIAIVDILEDLGQQTANYIEQNYQTKVKFYKVDITDYQQLEQLNEQITQDLGPVTVLINNAAIMFPSAIFEFTPQEIQNMINVNFTSTCYIHKIFVPKMKELNRGHIVNISSVAALFNSSLCGIYAATKAAVRSISSTLRVELLNECKNISVTTVMPVGMNTNGYVENFIRKSGLQKIFPFVDGNSAARYVLDAMLNNINEIAIPSSFLYIYKFVEFFPISIKEYILAFISLRCANNLRSANKKT